MVLSSDQPSENDGFFNGMIDEAHRAGFASTHGSPSATTHRGSRSTRNGGWSTRMAIARMSGSARRMPHRTRSSWPCSRACSTTTASTASTSITFAFPNAEVCQCPACRKELSRRASVNWPLGLALIDESDTQAAWFDYRGNLIHDLAEEFATAIRKWQEGVVVSASLKPEGAINFDGVKLGDFLEGGFPGVACGQFL